MRKTDDGKIFLTPKEAEQIIVKGDYVHTYVNPIGGIMVGADRSRQSILDDLEKYSDSIEIGGTDCRSMKHGIVIVKGNGSNLFINHDEAELEKIDPIDKTEEINPLQE